MTQRHGGAHSSSAIPCARRHGPDVGTLTPIGSVHVSTFRLGASVPASSLKVVPIATMGGTVGFVHACSVGPRPDPARPVSGGRLNGAPG
jgi:hypothetical protein